MKDNDPTTVPVVEETEVEDSAEEQGPTTYDWGAMG